MCLLKTYKRLLDSNQMIFRYSNCVVWSSIQNILNSALYVDLSGTHDSFPYDLFVIILDIFTELYTL